MLMEKLNLKDFYSMDAMHLPMDKNMGRDRLIKTGLKMDALVDLLDNMSMIFLIKTMSIIL